MVLLQKTLFTVRFHVMIHSLGVDSTDGSTGSATLKKPWLLANVQNLEDRTQCHRTFLSFILGTKQYFQGELFFLNEKVFESFGVTSLSLIRCSLKTKPKDFLFLIVPSCFCFLSSHQRDKLIRYK